MHTFITGVRFDASCGRIAMRAEGRDRAWRLQRRSGRLPKPLSFSLGVIQMSPRPRRGRRYRSHQATASGRRARRGSSTRRLRGRACSRLPVRSCLGRLDAGRPCRSLSAKRGAAGLEGSHQSAGATRRSACYRGLVEVMDRRVSGIRTASLDGCGSGGPETHVAGAVSLWLGLELLEHRGVVGGCPLLEDSPLVIHHEDVEQLPDDLASVGL